MHVEYRPRVIREVQQFDVTARKARLVILDSRHRYDKIEHSDGKSTMLVYANYKN